MNQPENNTSGSCPCVFSNGKTLAFLTLRLWIAMRAIMTVVEKFAGKQLVQKPLLDEFGEPDISGAIVEVPEKIYSFSNYHGIPASMEPLFQQEPLLPAWALSIYGPVLGILLGITGITLLLGIFTRISLAIQALLYVSLTFGMILIGQDAGIAWLGVHTIMIALALYWSDHNRFTITRN